jgi:hypothetical protein
MKRKMNTNLNDLLPTLFGLVALACFLTSLTAPSHSALKYANLGEGVLGTAAACLVTAVISVVTALREKRFSRIHILDLVWILPIGAYVGLFLIISLSLLIHPLRF